MVSYQNNEAILREKVSAAKVLLKKLPKPRCDSELAVITKIYFGAELSLYRLDCFGEGASYEVKQDYNSYHGEGFEYGKNCIHGYDHSSNFWKWAIGNTTCGGIARASYAQVKVFGHRNKQRIKYWIESRRGKQTNYLRAPFVRLAAQYRERREQTDSR